MAGAPKVFGAPATVASRAGGCPAGARDEITEAFSAVLDRGITTPANDVAARLAGSDDPALRQILDAWLLDNAGRNTTASVTHIRCSGPNRADLDVALILAGNPFPTLLPKGRAVRQQGVWKVSKSTFCARVIIEDPDLASQGASATTGARP